jgi:hypothetical protein
MPKSASFFHLWDLAQVEAGPVPRQHPGREVKIAQRHQVVAGRPLQPVTVGQPATLDERHKSIIIVQDPAHHVVVAEYPGDAGHSCEAVGNVVNHAGLRRHGREHLARLAEEAVLDDPRVSGADQAAGAYGIVDPGQAADGDGVFVMPAADLAGQPPRFLAEVFPILQDVPGINLSHAPEQENRLPGKLLLSRQHIGLGKSDGHGGRVQELVMTDDLSNEKALPLGVAIERQLLVHSLGVLADEHVVLGKHFEAGDFAAEAADDFVRSVGVPIPDVFPPVLTAVRAIAGTHRRHARDVVEEALVGPPQPAPGVSDFFVVNLLGPSVL